MRRGCSLLFRLAALSAWFALAAAPALAQAATAAAFGELASAAKAGHLSSSNGTAEAVPFQGSQSKARIQTPAADHAGHGEAHADGGLTLATVLNKMDDTASSFKSAQADFVWNQYAKVVNETDTQKGKIYFRRSDNKLQVAASFAAPENKYMVYDGSKARVYQPGIDQVTEYSAGKNKAEFESFLVLGFGGRGHDLEKSFEVKLEGAEPIESVRTAKLELTPKTQKSRNVFSHILLWIDMERGVSLQQQFFEPSGDYRLARYSHIEVNKTLPEGAFKLKTTSKTKVLKPQGD